MTKYLNMVVAVLELGLGFAKKHFWRHRVVCFKKDGLHVFREENRRGTGCRFELMGTMEHLNRVEGPQGSFRVHGNGLFKGKPRTQTQRFRALSEQETFALTPGMAAGDATAAQMEDRWRCVHFLATLSHNHRDHAPSIAQE